MQETEKLYTMKEAARLMNIPYWKILRATNAGLIPSYKLLNSKQYVKLSEIEKALQ